MSSFPSALDTLGTLGVSRDNASSALTAPMSATDTTATVANGSLIPQWSYITFGAELMQVSLVTGNVLTFGTPAAPGSLTGRGLSGTTIAAHASGVIGYVDVNALYQQNLSAAVRAVQAALGVNLGNVVQQAAGTFVNPVSGVSASFTGAQTISPSRMVGLLSKLATIKSGTTATMPIAAFGDSWTAGQVYLNPLRLRLQQAWGNGGAGYVSFQTTTDTLPTGVGRATTGTWTDVLSIYAPDTGATSSVDFATPAQKSVQSLLVDTFKIFYRGGGGVFRYQIDALGWTSIDTSAQSGNQTVSVSAAAGLHTIYVQPVSGAAVTLFGVECMLTTASGVRIDSVARDGQTCQYFATLDQTALTFNLNALNPAAITVMLGINDWQTGRTSAQFQADLTTFVGKLRTARPYSDIILLTQCDSGYVSPDPATFAPFIAAIQAVALANNLAFVSLYDVVGPFNSNVNGLFGVNVHPNAAGGQLMAEVIAWYLPQHLENATLRGNLATLGGNNTALSWTGIETITNAGGTITMTPGAAGGALSVNNGTASSGIQVTGTEAYVGTDTGGGGYHIRSNGVDRIVVTDTSSTFGAGANKFLIVPLASPSWSLISPTATASLTLSGADAFLSLETAGVLHIRTNNIDRIAIDSTGNVAVKRNLSTAVNAVASSATPAFDCGLGGVQTITLTSNAVATVNDLIAGQEVTFVISQDATGSRTFTWPGAVHGGMTIGTTASKANVQKFVCPDGANLYAITPGVINQ